MTAKISAARKAAFLKALGESGNQTLAAERAKVSRSWVVLQRKEQPKFDAAVRAAVAEAKERLRVRFSIASSGSGQASIGADETPNAGASGQSNRPPGGWGFLDGAELVVRGSGGTGGRRVQIARARLKQWTVRVEDRFLATLAATCNVKAACAEVGMTAASAYAHRKRWPRFAEKWEEAVESGYRELHGALIAAGINLFSPDETPEPGRFPPMTVAEALHCLNMHGRARLGIGWPARLAAAAAALVSAGLSRIDTVSDLISINVQRRGSAWRTDRSISATWKRARKR